MTRNLLKAAKGTPQYEAWLRKYREKKGVKQPSLFGNDDPGKGKVTAKDLKAKPPKIAKDKEVWKQAVDKITNNGEKPGSYGACIMLYKRKLEKKQKEQEAYNKLPAQLREDDIPWEKAVSDVCSFWESRFRGSRLENLDKATKGTPAYQKWLEQFRAKRKPKAKEYTSTQLALGERAGKALRGDFDFVRWDADADDNIIIKVGPLEGDTVDLKTLKEDLKPWGLEVKSSFEDSAGYTNCVVTASEGFKQKLKDDVKNVLRTKPSGANGNIPPSKPTTVEFDEDVEHHSENLDLGNGKTVKVTHVYPSSESASDPVKEDRFNKWKEQRNIIRGITDELISTVGPIKLPKEGETVEIPIRGEVITITPEKGNKFTFKGPAGEVTYPKRMFTMNFVSPISLVASLTTEGSKAQIESEKYFRPTPEQKYID